MPDLALRNRHYEGQARWDRAVWIEAWVFQPGLTDFRRHHGWHGPQEYPPRVVPVLAAEYPRSGGRRDWAYRYRDHDYRPERIQGDFPGRAWGVWLFLSPLHAWMTALRQARRREAQLRRNLMDAEAECMGMETMVKMGRRRLLRAGGDAEADR